MPVPSRRSVPVDAAADPGSEPARGTHDGREEGAAPAPSRTPPPWPDGRLPESAVEAADAAAPKPARRSRRKAAESDPADANAAQGDAEGTDDKPSKAGKEKAAKAAPKLVKTDDKLAKLGLTRSIDLVLHLPMRYEDETTLTPMRELLPGELAQTEGVVYDNEVTYSPRHQLLVRLRDENGSELVLRFLNFYGSQVKQMAIGQRLRVRGDIRGGFFGLEIVHPAVRAVDEDTPLAQVLTPPVYPSTVGVSQDYLRKAIDNALARTPLPELLPAEVEAAYLRPLGMPALADAVRQLHHPGVDSDETALIDGTHPAWIRIKFDELLAQQLSLKRAHEERRARGTGHAAPCRGQQRLAVRAAVRDAAVLADRRADTRGRRDRARPDARAPDAAAAAGRRGQRQNGGGRAGRRAGD